MSKKTNDGKNVTSGFGTADVSPVATLKPDPGARNHTDADWVRKDREYKESLPVIAYS